MKPYKKTREQNIKFVVKNWNQMTKREMADKLGVTEGTIHNWRRAFLKENRAEKPQNRP